MNFFERNEIELTEKLLLSEGGGVSEGGVNYCICRKTSANPQSLRSSGISIEIRSTSMGASSEEIFDPELLPLLERPELLNFNFGEQ